MSTPIKPPPQSRYRAFLIPKVSLCPCAACEPPPHPTTAPGNHCSAFCWWGCARCQCFGGNKPIARLSMTTSPLQLTGLPLGNTQTGPCPRAFAGAVPFAGWLVLQVAASSLPQVCVQVSHCQEAFPILCQMVTCPLDTTSLCVTSCVWHTWFHTFACPCGKLRDSQPSLSGLLL